MTAEVIFMWVAITTYAVGAALFIAGVIFEKEKFTRVAFWVSIAGMIPQIAAFGVRWQMGRVDPTLGYYEATSALSLASMFAYAFLSWRQPKMKPVGIVLMPIVMLILAGTLFSPRSGLEITGALASYWLVIHVLFSNLGFGSFVASFSLASVYLLRARSTSGLWLHSLERLPDQDVVDDLSARFAAVGLLFWGVMIASGSIWANEAWGRYWGWDAIETWSLIVWLVYAAYLHSRLVMGWRGEKSAWIAILALPLCAFSLLGTPLVFDSIHAGYLGR